MKYEEEEVFLRTVVGHGLERDDLRDEIYVMCKKVVTKFELANICLQFLIFFQFASVEQVCDNQPIILLLICVKKYTNFLLFLHLFG